MEIGTTEEDAHRKVLLGELKKMADKQSLFHFLFRWANPADIQS